MRLAVALLPFLASLPAAAETHDTGEALYLARCAACHGPEARGDGAMAALLSVQVADLTRIAARNGGAFPLADVVRTIDGRMQVRGHTGGGPMPVFGPILGGGSAVIDAPDGSAIETRGDVVRIAHYLETLQEAGE